MTKPISRRHFIKNTSLAAAGFTIVPRHVLGGKGFTAPSDKLNIALIGCGGKAGNHIDNVKKHTNIVALCDVDDRRAKDAFEAFPKAARFRDFRRMFDDPIAGSIDAVMVTTPDHTHAPATLLALEAKKHVYTEKPLTHNIAEARQLLAAAKKAGVVTQMGNQGASMDCNAEVAEWIQSGAIGDVTRVHVWTNRPVWPQGLPTPAQETVPDGLDWNLWLGPAPQRTYSEHYLPFRWRGWWDFGTGALGDMGCHLIDPAYRALKLTYPTAIEASATTVWSDEFQEALYADSCPPSSMVRMEFPAREGMPACELWWYDGGIRPMRPAELGSDERFGSWDGGVLFEGSKGKMLCDMYGENATLLPTKRMKDFDKPKKWLPRYKDNHQMVWVNACKGEGKSSSPFEYAVPLTEAILIGNLAVRCFDIKKLGKGKKPDSWQPWDYPGRLRLEWDAAAMRITNFEDANAFVGREARQGW